MEGGGEGAGGIRNAPVVGSPTFNPVAGTYTTTQTVTIGTATIGASIRYTTDGSTPSETAGTLYSAPVTVSATTTINAIAYKTGMTDSAVQPATYTIPRPVTAAPVTPTLYTCQTQTTAATEANTTNTAITCS